MKSESIDTYLNSESAQVTKEEFTSSGKNFLVSTGDGSIELYDTDGKKELTFLKLGTGDALIVLKDLRYQLFGTRNLKGVGFAYKGRGYGFEQFDLGFNQPDSVVERLAAIFSWKDKSIVNRIERYKKYREARIKNNGFTSILSDPSKFHAPEVKILSKPDKQISKENKISVTFRSKDSSGKNLIGYKIFVNGVPIYGDYVKRKSPDGKEIFTKEISDAYQIFQKTFKKQINKRIYLLEFGNYLLDNFDNINEYLDEIIHPTSKGTDIIIKLFVQQLQKIKK